MHDGQNLFDAITSYAGEWNVDETLDQLQKKGDFTCIVIGIDNGGGNRINEYSAYKNPKYGGGQGDAYMRFVAQTLKPYVDQHYRTLPDAAHTGLMGSSLGGLITLYGGLTYGDVFGRVGVFSPSLWFSDSIYTLAASQGPTGPESGLYFMSGRQESKTQVQEQARMVQTLQTSGWQLPQEVDSLTQNGTHSESLWRIAFQAAYAWLFGSITSVDGKQPKSLSITLWPNPGIDGQALVVKTNYPINGTCQLVDTWGRTVCEATMSAGACRFNTNSLAKGVYQVWVEGMPYRAKARWLK
jgi:metallo-beta-lactamase class B